MRRALFLLGYLNALPLTLVGLWVALVGRTRFIHFEGGAALFVAKPGGLVDFVFRKTGAHGGGGWCGGVVFLAQPSLVLSPSLVRHELRHFAQARVFGPLWVVLYGLASLAALLLGGHPYFDNALEKDARAAEAA